MHGELAQLVALAAHGSAYLAGAAAADAPELFPTSAAFRFTTALEFRRDTRRFGILRADCLVANACAPWYADLRGRGVVSLRLVRGGLIPWLGALAPYIGAGLSGGVAVAIAADFAGGDCERWEGAWDVTARDHPEQRIWSAQFRGARTRVRPPEPPDFDSAMCRLDAALGEAEDLVRGRPNFADWELVFRRSRELLTAGSTEVPHFPDLLPATGYELRARRLLAAASSAWVFGGMGSWNDVAIEGAQRRYDLVTAELFEAVLDAIVAATNAHDSRAQSW